MGGVVTHRLGLFNSVAPASYSGALVRNSADQDAGGANTYNPSWDTEVYDNGGWHSGSSTRLTVPTSVSLVRVVANNDDDDRGGCSIHKGGAVFRGMGAKTTDTAGQCQTCVSTALIEVSAGDYFQVEAYSPASASSSAANSWFAVEKVDGSTKRALVNRTTNQAISAATTTTINWTAEVYDTDSWHDTGSNTSRLTVPSGVTLVRVGGNLIADQAGQAVLSFFKNGAGARGLPAYDCEVSLGSERLNAWSAPLVVSAGDYFEMRVFSTDGHNVGTDERNWFAIEEVPSTYKRALVNKSGNQSVNDGTTTSLTWDQEVYDTDAIHDNSTNNSRLTVPSGVTQARLSFSIRTPSATGQMVATVRKNGTGTGGYGHPASETDTAGTDSICALGAWIDVVAGDYFEVRFFQASGGAMNIGTDNETWFCMECR